MVSTPAVISPDRRDLAWGVALLFVALITHFAFVRVGIHNPPNDGHEFRQTQTALTAYWMLREGWSMDSPLPLFGPDWKVPLEFPLYQSVLAGVCATLDTPLEPTGRMLSLFFLYVTLPGTFLLGRRLGLSPGLSLLIPATLLLTPVYLFYGRAISIESTALCLSTWFLLVWWGTLDNPTPRNATLALILGATAALAKITTFAVFLMPVTILFLARAIRCGRPNVLKTVKRLSLPAVIPILTLAVGYAWVVHSDTVKAANPLASFLTSASIAQWNYGSPGDRISATFWTTLIETTHRDVLVYGNLLLALLLGFTAPLRWRWIGLALLISFLIGPLVFTNLYVTHNYYYCANALFLVALLVIGWSRLIALAGAGRTWGWIAVGGSMLLQAHGFYSTAFRIQRTADSERPAIARVIQATTAPSEVMVLIGQVWNPAIPYYAERKAIMPRFGLMADSTDLRTVLARLSENEQVGALVVVGHDASTPAQEAGLAMELGLLSQPAFEANQNRIYLSPDRVTELRRTLPDQRLHGYTFHQLSESAVPGITLQRFNIETLADQKPFHGFTPLPDEVRVPFGISEIRVDGFEVLSIHAPTNIKVPLPAGATSLDLEFGMLSSAFANGNVGDGVTMRVEFRPSGESRRQLLWEAALDPYQRPADRALQDVQIDFNNLPAGDAFLLITPGPAHYIDFDWVYVRRVEWHFDATPDSSTVTNP